MQKYKKETILSITLRPREKVTFKTFLEAGCSQLRSMWEGALTFEPALYLEDDPKNQGICNVVREEMSYLFSLV